MANIYYAGPQASKALSQCHWQKDPLLKCFDYDLLIDVTLVLAIWFVLYNPKVI